MSGMIYYVGYYEDKIVEFSFYPRWCTAKGETNEKLGIALFSVFRVMPQWRLSDDGRLIRALTTDEYISIPQSVKQLVEEAQQRISMMLDEAQRVLPILKAKFDSY